MPQVCYKPEGHPGYIQLLPDLLRVCGEVVRGFTSPDPTVGNALKLTVEGAGLDADVDADGLWIYEYAQHVE